MSQSTAASTAAASSKPTVAFAHLGCEKNRVDTEHMLGLLAQAGYGVSAGAAKVTKNGSQWTATEAYRFAGNKPLANHWSTPVLKEGHLFGMFQFKEYGNGPVKCVDIATGTVKWEQPGFGPGHVILTASGVLALSDDGHLVLIDPNTSAYKELARADVLDGKCWTTPVLANGKVFARSTKEAVCLDLGR